MTHNQLKHPQSSKKQANNPLQTFLKSSKRWLKNPQRNRHLAMFAMTFASLLILGSVGWIAYETETQEKTVIAQADNFGGSNFNVWECNVSGTVSINRAGSANPGINYNTADLRGENGDNWSGGKAYVPWLSSQAPYTRNATATQVAVAPGMEVQMNSHFINHSGTPVSVGTTYMFLSTPNPVNGGEDVTRLIQPSTNSKAVKNGNVWYNSDLNGTAPLISRARSGKYVNTEANNNIAIANDGQANRNKMFTFKAVQPISQVKRATAEVKLEQNAGGQYETVVYYTYYLKNNSPYQFGGDHIRVDIQNPVNGQLIRQAVGDFSAGSEKQVTVRVPMGVGTSTVNPPVAKANIWMTRPITEMTSPATDPYSEYSRTLLFDRNDETYWNGDNWGKQLGRPMITNPLSVTLIPHWFEVQEPELRQIVDLAVQKEVVNEKAFYQAGELVEWDVTVTNVGQTAVTQFKITDTFYADQMENPELISVTQTPTNKGTTSTPVIRNYDSVGQRTDFDFTWTASSGNTFNRNENITFRIRTRVKDSVTNCSGIPNRVIVTSLSPEEYTGPTTPPITTMPTQLSCNAQGNNCDMADIAAQCVLTPDIQIVKELSANTPGPFGVGDEIEFRFTVTNIGDTVIDEFVLSDLWPDSINPPLTNNQWRATNGSGVQLGEFSNPQLNGQETKITWTGAGNQALGRSTLMYVYVRTTIKTPILQNQRNYVKICIEEQGNTLPNCVPPRQVCDEKREDCALIPPTPTAKIEKTIANINQAPFGVSDAISFDFKITNDGSSALTEYTLRELWPAQVTPSGTYSIVSGGGSLSGQTLDSVVWKGSLAVGSSVVIRTAGTVNAAILADTYNYVRLCLETDENYPTCILPREVCDERREDCALIPPTPEAKIEKVIANLNEAPFAIGENVRFRFTITNNGSANLTEYTLRELWPAQVTPSGTYSIVSGGGDLSGQTLDSVVWKGSLAVGSSVVIETTGRVNAPILADTYNYVRLCLQTDSNYPTCVPPRAVCDERREDCALIPPTPNARIVKVINNLDEAPFAIGDNVEFYFTITNEGPGTLNAFTLRENWPTQITPNGQYQIASGGGSLTNQTIDSVVWNGTLAQGASVVIRTTGTVNAAILADTYNYVRLCLETDENYPTCIPPREVCDERREDCALIPPTPDVLIQKTIANINQAPFVIGENIEFRFSVQNTSQTNISKFTLNELWPTQVTPSGTYSIVSGGGSLSGQSVDSVIWTGTLQPGQTVIISTSAVVNALIPNNTYNYVKVCLETDENCSEPEEVCDEQREDCALIPPTPEVMIDKQIMTAGPYSIGQDIRFRFVITNTSQTNVSEFTLNEVWPAQVTPSGTYSIVSGGGSLSGQSVAQVRWTGTLQPGQTITIDTLGKVNAAIPVNTKNLVSVCLPTDQTCQPPVDYPECENDPATPRDDCAFIDPNQDIKIQKTISNINQAPYAIGDEIVFNFTVTNTGQANISRFTLRELWPSSLQVNVSTYAIVSGGGQLQNVTAEAVDWVGNLGIGKQVVIEVKAKVTSEITPKTYNYVRVCIPTTGQNAECEIPDEICPTSGDNQQDCAEIPPVPRARIEKNLINNGGLQIGGQAEFTFTITNTGTTTINQYVLRELWPSQLTPSGTYSIVSGGGALSNQSADSVTWTGSLQPGQRVVISTKATINQMLLLGGYNYVRLCIDSDVNYPTCNTPDGTPSLSCDKERQDCAGIPPVTPRTGGFYAGVITAIMAIVGGLVFVVKAAKRSQLQITQ